MLQRTREEEEEKEEKKLASPLLPKESDEQMTARDSVKRRRRGRYLRKKKPQISSKCWPSFCVYCNFKPILLSGLLLGTANYAVRTLLLFRVQKNDNFFSCLFLPSEESTLLLATEILGGCGWCACVGACGTGEEEEEEICEKWRRRWPEEIFV